MIGDNTRANTTVDELVNDIKLNWPAIGGRAAFLEDPGGYIDYLGLTTDDETAAAAIERIRGEASWD
jgi:hypothetical protein